MHTAPRSASLRPYLPEYGVMPPTALLEDSGKTSFSKWKRRFHFEEEEQRNERALARRAEANDMELVTTSGRELCVAANRQNPACTVQAGFLSAHTILFRRVPMPSMVTATSSPGFSQVRWPLGFSSTTPEGVPVKMRSSGSRGVNWET